MPSPAGSASSFQARNIAASMPRQIGTMSRDSHAWYRQSADDIFMHRDGITLDASGNGAATRFFGKSLGRFSDDTANAYWLDATSSDQVTGSAFGILSSAAANSRADQLDVGRLFQSMHLWAVSQGLAVQPLNQLAELQDREDTQGLEPRFTAVLNPGPRLCVSPSLRCGPLAAHPRPVCSPQAPRSPRPGRLRAAHQGACCWQSRSAWGAAPSPTSE